MKEASAASVAAAAAATTIGTPPHSQQARLDTAPTEDPIKALLEKIKQNKAAVSLAKNETASTVSNGTHGHGMSRHSSFNSTKSFFANVDASTIPHPPHAGSHRHHHHHHQGQPPYPALPPPLHGMYPYPPGSEYYNYDMRYYNENGGYHETTMKRNKSASYLLESSKNIE